MDLHLEINDLRAILDALDESLSSLYRYRKSVEECEKEPYSLVYIRLTEELQRKNRIAMEIATLIDVEWESYVK